MNVVTKPRMTLDEFLAWEREQEFAHEFEGERIIPATNGGPASHYLIALNLAVLLRPLLDPARFTIVPIGVKLVWNGRVRYPDLTVAAAFKDTLVDSMPEPIVVFEVISPSSVKQDTVIKNLEYRSNPSIQQYVVLEQDSIAATSWQRDGENWTGTLLSGKAALQLPPLGVSIPLAAIYERVTLAASG